MLFTCHLLAPCTLVMKAPMDMFAETLQAGREGLTQDTKPDDALRWKLGQMMRVSGPEVKS